MDTRRPSARTSPPLKQALENTQESGIATPVTPARKGSSRRDVAEDRAPQRGTRLSPEVPSRPADAAAMGARQAAALGATLGEDASPEAKTADLARLFAHDLPAGLEFWADARRARDLVLTGLSSHPALAQAISEYYGTAALYLTSDSGSFQHEAIEQLRKVAPSAEADARLATHVRHITDGIFSRMNELGTSVALDSDFLDGLEEVFRARPGIAEALGADDVAQLQRFMEAFLHSSAHEGQRTHGAYLRTASAIAGLTAALSKRTDGSMDAGAILGLLEAHEETARAAATLSLALGGAPSAETTARLLEEAAEVLGKLDESRLFYSQDWLSARVSVLGRIAALPEAGLDPAVLAERLTAAATDDAVRARVVSLLERGAPTETPLFRLKVGDTELAFTDAPTARPESAPTPATGRAELEAALTSLEGGFGIRTFMDSVDAVLLALADPLLEGRARSVLASALESPRSSVFRALFERTQALHGTHPEEAPRVMSALVQAFETSVEDPEAAMWGAYALENSPLPAEVRLALLQSAAQSLRTAYEGGGEARRETASGFAFAFRELTALTPGWTEVVPAEAFATLREQLAESPVPGGRFNPDDDPYLRKHWAEASPEAKALIAAAVAAAAQAPRQ